ncbi:hypothetical protein [uncultured Winogradskyella sp.]|uniref:hypothetical protein n=1 Tax=uncultured Winogradskyella sp. TaxID=395353 RepID=UPI00261E5480|nr:hypothetical protein [uncultured Winogradskyella sp.]
MKNKKKTYILLILVLAVWGTIGYKIISALNPDLPDIQQQDFAVNTNYKLDTKIDTFSIQTVNRDPFLGTYLKKKSKKKTKIKRKETQWKPVHYYGIVKKDKNQMFIVTINNKQYLLKKGQTKDSITLVYGTTKSITMRYKNNSRTFYLKQK